MPLEQLQRLLLVQKGQIYSQQLIAATQQLIENRLGVDGYAFAKVDPVPKLDDEKKEVVMTFLVDPGKRVYVRHITFAGVTRTNDVVLRREMRQLEGSWVSNIALERSKQRLQAAALHRGSRLREEAGRRHRTTSSTWNSRSRKARARSSPAASAIRESSSFMLNGSYADSNFIGTGKRMAFDLNTGKYAGLQLLAHQSVHWASTTSRARSACATRMSRSSCPRPRTSRPSPWRPGSSSAIPSPKCRACDSA